MVHAFGNYLSHFNYATLLFPTIYASFFSISVALPSKGANNSWFCCSLSLRGYTYNITARLACKKVERGKLLCTKCRTSHWTRGLFSYQMSLHQVVQKENMQQILRNNVNSRYPLHVHFNSSSAMAVQVILYGDTFLTQSVVTPLSTWLPISRSVKKKRSD